MARESSLQGQQDFLYSTNKSTYFEKLVNWNMPVHSPELLLALFLRAAWNCKSDSSEECRGGHLRVSIENEYKHAKGWSC